MSVELSYPKLFFNDGTRLTAIKEAVKNSQIDPNSVIGTLADYQHIYGDRIDFVGLIEFNGNVPALVVFLPKGHRPSEKVFYAAGETPELYLVNGTKLTFDCLGRYFSERKSGGSETWLDRDIERREFQEWARIDSAIWLINDWRAYGLYQDSYTRYRSGSPSEKVDWKRTLKRQRPLWTENGPYYQRCQVRERLSSQAGMISQIHRWCVYQAFRLAGWLTQDAAITEIELLSDKYAMHADQSTAKLWALALTAQLELEFSDRRIELIRRLQTLLGGGSFSKGTKVAGISKFERVWEEMCSVVLDNQYKEHFEAIMPQPSYLGPNKNKLPTYQRQIPDIVFGVSDSLFYVIDAKYYTVPESLPGWGDIGKQFLYAWCLRGVVKKDSTVHNVFLFPAPAKCDPLKLPEEVIVEAGGAVVPYLSNLVCIYFDIEEVMKAYARKYNCQSVSDFRKAIDVALSRSLGIVPKAIMA